MFQRFQKQSSEHLKRNTEVGEDRQTSGRKPACVGLNANRKEGEPMQEANHQPPESSEPDQRHGGDRSTMSRRLDGPSEKPRVPMEGWLSDLLLGAPTFDRLELRTQTIVFPDVRTFP